MNQSEFIEQVNTRALKIRAFENTLLSLYEKGLLNGTIHTCIGQEVIGSTIGLLLNEEDYILSNHRGHGHYIGRFDDYKPLLAEIMGKKEGCSGGYGGSQHVCGRNFISNGIQGGMTPIALGIAVSNKLKGNGAISVVFIGDGTLGQGVLYETMNFASVLNAPLLIIAENNGYAQSTPQKLTFRGNLKYRTEGFGFDYFNTSTLQPTMDNLIEIAGSAIKNARKKGPTFLEIETYRLNAHSKGDDNRFASEVNNARQNDYLSLLLENEVYLLKYQEYISELNGLVDVLNKSESLSSINKIEERNVLNPDFKLAANDDIRYNQKINRAMHDLMAEYDNILLLGEDIIDRSEYTEFQYGGAFKVTLGLSTKYGSRVFNSPISEQCLTGVSTGLGLSGFCVFEEIMFGDFTSLILDQVLQHLTKFEIMFNKYVRPSVIIRTPMGGKRGYGPTHSQSLERFFLGIPNLRVITLNKYISPFDIFHKLMLDNVPSIVVENKILYTEKSDYYLNDYYTYEVIKSALFPVVTLFPKDKYSNTFVTILTYGQCITEIEYAAEYFYFEDEITFEIFCFSRIDKIDCQVVIESIRRTGKVLIVEEGYGYAGWGSELIAKISESEDMHLKIIRMYNDYIIPCSLEAEMNLIPNKNSIINKIKELL